MLSVLIVDDHPHLVEHLATTVPWEELGIAAVHTAYSGQEAMETIRAAPVDILLTDIRMPGMTGLELIEQARLCSADIGCVLLTGYAEFEYARKAIELRTFRYLMKPVRMDELVACLRELVADSQRKRPREESPLPLGQSLNGRQGEDADSVAGGLETGKPQGGGKVIEAVHDYVLRHIGGDVTLTAIAEHVYLHPVYLSKLYKESTGTNLSETILSARMDKAKELLRNSPLKIYEIGAMVGYRSTQHFITEFKKSVGATPKQYRDS